MKPTFFESPAAPLLAAPAPTPSGAAALPDRTLSSWRSRLLTAAACAAVFRVLVEAVGLWAVRDRPWTAGTTYRIWAQWDANWYTMIATRGYAALSPLRGSGGHLYDAVAFPPLYPLLVHAATITGLAAPVAALALSWLMLVAAMMALLGLVEHDHGQAVARTTAILLLASPAAFLLVTGYAESLLLAAVAWSFVAARARRWWLAGLLIGLAALTKLFAIAIVLPLVVEWASQPDRRRADLAWPLALPALAVGAWAAYLEAIFHDPLRMLTAQRYWDHHAAPPWEAIGGALRSIHGLHVGLLDLATVPLVAAAAVYAYRRLRPSYVALILVSLAVYTSTATLASVNRYALTLFPLYLSGALLVRGRRWLLALMLATSIPVEVVLAARFATGHWAG